MSTERIEIVASAVDEATATLRQIDAQVRQVGASAGKVDAAVEKTASGVSDRIKGVAEAGPLRATNALNELAGRVMQIPALAGMVVGAVTAVGAGVAALIEALSDPLKDLERDAAATAGAVGQVAENVQGTADKLASTLSKIRQDQIDLLRAAGEDERAEALEQMQLREEQAQRAQSLLDQQREGETALRVARVQTMVQERVVAAQRKQLADEQAEFMESQFRLGKRGERLEAELDAWRRNVAAGTLAALTKAELGLADSKRREADATALLIDLEAQLQTQREQAQLRMAGLLRQAAEGAQGGAAGAVERPRTPGGRGGGGGGTPLRETTEDSLAIQRRQLLQQATRDELDADERAEKRAAALESLRRFGAEAMASAREAAEKSALQQAIDDADKLASVLQDSLAPAFGDVGVAVAGLGKQIALLASGQEVSTETAIAATGALAESVARSIGGERAWMAVRAARELAMGFATLENPAISAGHFTAAALLGAEAAMGGGGGSASRGVTASAPWAGTQERRDDTPSGGVTIVNNFTAGVMDAQATARSVRQVERSARGTGTTHRMGT